MHPYFQILGISNDSSIADVKRAYRNKAKLYHPDVNRESGNVEKFIAVTEAYDMIMKLYKRNVYAREIIQRGKSNHEWLQEQMMKSKMKAAQYSEMRYAEFKKSVLYKSAIITYRVTYFVYFITGLVILVFPLIFADLKHVLPDDIATRIVGHVMAFIIGIIMVVFFGHSLYMMLIKKEEL